MAKSPHWRTYLDLQRLRGFSNHMMRWVFLVCVAVLHVEAGVNESAFLSRIRQLTFEGKSGEGYFSPDGSQLVFQSVREPQNPFYQIYILDFASGDMHRVSPGFGKTTCAFFRPQSDEVIFASTHLDPDAKKKQEEELAFIASGKTRRYSWDYDAAMDIFSARRDGSNLKRLTDAPGYDAEGSVSPDGTKIAFTSLRAAFPLEQLSADERKRYETDPAYFAEIFIMNADGSGQKRLTFSPGYDGGPFFMPDGQRIVWRRFDTNGVIADVFTMKLDGSDVRQVTHFNSMSWAPYPHPSGKYIIFTSNKLGFENFELFLVDTEGKHEPVRVTFTDDFDGLPVFSPDGKQLCWTSNRKGKPSQLFLASWNHEAALAALDLGEQTAKGQIDEHPARGAAQLSPEIRANDLRAHLSYLASDELEGRKTGERGARKAAAYIADQLMSFALQPLPAVAGRMTNGGSAFLEPFDFTAGVVTDTNETRLSVMSGAESFAFDPEKDFRPIAFSSNGEFDGEVVFAGYGLSVPGEAAERYDSYNGLNVTNKIVLVLRYVPENVEPKRREELNRYAAPRYKAMIAREHGAKAILIVSGPNSPTAGQLIPLSSDGALSGSAILAASISLPVAEKIVASSGKTLKELQSALDTENPHAEKGMVLTHTRVRLKVALERQRRTDANVVALLPGATGEYVMAGAHYDHLGFGESSDSRQIKGEEHQVHNGADDNASGVSAVLELAQAFAAGAAKAAPPKRGIIFAFWSGEEMGLLGSSWFVEHPPVPLSNIVAYLNFDMVGRSRDHKLILQGTGSSPSWGREIERRNAAAGFDLSLQKDPYLPTDTTAFYPKGIPVLSFFTGSHDDYHRPSDDAEKINYEALEEITRFASNIVQDIVSAPDRPVWSKVERSSSGGDRDALRVYLGTIPDYATEVNGVKLSGVRAGSPAEKGGLKAGDIIVEFAGRKISNIYDYTYALDAAKIGQPLKLKVQRENGTVELTVTPEARK